MLSRWALPPLVTLLLVTLTSATAWGQGQPDRAARIAKLIEQLGHDDFPIREAATQALAEFGNSARAALQKAAASPDAETAQRARSILDKLPDLTHTLVDALGQPIPLASITITAVGRPLPPVPGIDAPEETAVWPAMVADEDGRFGVPKTAEGQSFTARVEHPDYGIARCSVETAKDRLIVPLVRTGSEARRRALAGRIATASGEPVVGAAIVCNHVRTPGEGLIDPLYPRGTVLSDAEGRFAIYPPSENRNRERGDLIPENSRFSLSLTPPSEELLPLSFVAANTQVAQVLWPEPKHFHRFRFAAVGGGWLEDAEQPGHVHVQLETSQDGERLLTPLDTAALVAGRKLLPGKYLAESFAGGKRTGYLPVTIKDDSPVLLDFLLEPAVTYEGQVVSGVTLQPIADAIVFAYSATSRNNLALLTPDDWKQLAECPSNPPADHPAMKRLGELYGVEGLVKAGADGRFAITRQPDSEFYGLIACAENQIPYTVRLFSVKATAGRADTGQFLLFPAAKVQVRPVFDGPRLAVSPFWLLEKDGQPEWFARFRTAFNGSDRCLEYVHWLALNELQPVFVPAGVRLRLRLESPYDDKWTPATIDERLQLEPGTSRDLGDVRFAAALPVSVRVVNARGEPVEGLAVRRMYRGENAWSLAHNTDASGLAHFHVPANSQGRFRVSDLAGPKDVVEAANLAADFAIQAAPPDKPFEITVTDEQIKLLRNVPSAGPPR